MSHVIDIHILNNWKLSWRGSKQHSLCHSVLPTLIRTPAEAELFWYMLVLFESRNSKVSWGHAPVRQIDKFAITLIKPLKEALICVGVEPKLEIGLDVGPIPVLGVACLQPMLCLKQQGVIVCARATWYVKHPGDHIPPPYIPLACRFIVPAQQLNRWRCTNQSLHRTIEPHDGFNIDLCFWTWFQKYVYFVTMGTQS